MLVCPTLIYTVLIHNADSINNANIKTNSPIHIFLIQKWNTFRHFLKLSYFGFQHIWLKTKLIHHTSRSVGCLLGGPSAGTIVWLQSPDCLPRAGWPKKASLTCLVTGANCCVASFFTWFHCSKNPSTEFTRPLEALLRSCTKSLLCIHWSEHIARTTQSQGLGR